MVRLVFIAALCLIALPVQAAECDGNGIQLKEPALCSRTFDFSGTCGVPKYTTYPHWDTLATVIGAWEKTAIRIVIASVDVMVESADVGLRATTFAGNSYNADALTPEKSATAPSAAGPNSLAIHSEARFPSDDGMQFPAGEPADTTHLDVHLTCFPHGAGYGGSLTVWYKLDPAIAPAQADAAPVAR